MTKEEISEKKSKLIDDIIYGSTIQVKLLAIDALWYLAKLEGAKEANDLGKPKCIDSIDRQSVADVSKCI